MNLAPVQIAYHVSDPAAAAAQYARRFGWGPFFLLEHIPLTRALHRDQPAEFDHSSAYGQAGEMMIEFITQHNDGPSALRDMYRPDQTGIHHVACFVPELAKALQEFRGQGFAIALDACTSTGVEFAMVDTSTVLGHMLELYEPGNDLKRFYGFVRKAALDWDGREPVRRLG